MRYNSMTTVERQAISWCCHLQPVILMLITVTDVTYKYITYTKRLYFKGHATYSVDMAFAHRGAELNIQTSIIYGYLYAKYYISFITIRHW